MRKSLFLFALLCTVWMSAQAQTPKQTFGCNLAAVYGKKEAQLFPSFDHRLREALSTQNVAALALLVNYPLRVNSDHGPYYIDNAVAFQSRFQSIFPAAIRNAVIHRKPSDVSCTQDGIAYANGDLYADLENFGFAVTVVNLPPSSQPSPGNHIRFACRTNKFRVLVDSPQKGQWRYRSWNAGRSVLDTPNLTLTHGTQSYEGTDGCEFPTWTFRNGSRTYSVSTLGCFPDSNRPPQGARGQLEVDSHGKTLLREWCY